LFIGSTGDSAHSHQRCGLNGPPCQMPASVGDAPLSRGGHQCFAQVFRRHVSEGGQNSRLVPRGGKRDALVICKPADLAEPGPGSLHRDSGRIAPELFGDASPGIARSGRLLISEALYRMNGLLGKRLLDHRHHRTVGLLRRTRGRPVGGKPPDAWWAQVQRRQRWLRRERLGSRAVEGPRLQNGLRCKLRRPRPRGCRRIRGKRLLDHRRHRTDGLLRRTRGRPVGGKPPDAWWAQVQRRQRWLRRERLGSRAVEGLHLQNGLRCKLRRPRPRGCRRIRGRRLLGHRRHGTVGLLRRTRGRPVGGKPPDVWWAQVQRRQRWLRRERPGIELGRLHLRSGLLHRLLRGLLRGRSEHTVTPVLGVCHLAVMNA